MCRFSFLARDLTVRGSIFAQRTAARLGFLCERFRYDSAGPPALSRKRGFSLKAASYRFNRGDAVVVARPSERRQVDVGSAGYFRT
jgi:hypothetical protein